MHRLRKYLPWMQFRLSYLPAQLSKCGWHFAHPEISRTPQQRPHFGLFKMIPKGAITYITEWNNRRKIPSADCPSIDTLAAAPTETAVEPRSTRSGRHSLLRPSGQAPPKARKFPAGGRDAIYWIRRWNSVVELWQTKSKPPTAWSTDSWKFWKILRRTRNNTELKVAEDTLGKHAPANV